MQLAWILAVALIGTASAQTDARLPRPSEMALTPERAVSVALDRAPALKAARARAAAEEADARAEGRLEDPRLTASHKSGSGQGRTEATLTFDLWSLIGLGKRGAARDAAAEKARAELAESALALAAETKSALYAVQAASATVILRREHAQAARAMAELAQGQRRAGNIAALDLEQELVAAEQAELDLDRSEADLQAARAQLARLMRVPTDSGWWTYAALPAPPDSDPDAAALAATAKARRPTLRAALAAAKAAEMRARAWSSASAGAFRVGVAAEREPDGTRLVGPAVDMDLPFFGGIKPRLDAVEARAEEAAARAEDADAELTEELETLRARLSAARRAARRYREVIVPARTRIVAETQLRYNGMLSGAYQLLMARQAETAARREAVEALREYWTVRAALERAVGGSL